MFTLASNFAGLLSRPEPHLIGPNAAQALNNVTLDNGSLQPLHGLGTTVATLQAGTYRSIYKFNGAWVNDAASVTIAWQYVEFGARLIRVAAGQVPQVSADGVTWYSLGITAPVVTPTGAAGAAGVLTGTYYYYYTYVSSLGGESAPSPVSAAIVVAGTKVDLTNIAVSADPQTTSRKIYRTGGTRATINLVTTIANNAATTYTDNTADTAVGAALQSTNYSPPGNLEWIAVAPYNRLFGGIGPNVYFCEAGLYHAWPATNLLTLTESTKGAAAFSGSMVVFTTASVYVIIGNSASTFAVQGVPTQQGCIERDTIVDMGHSLYYRSADGICAFAGRAVNVISKESLADSLLADTTVATSTNSKAVRYNERYILFFQGGTSFPAGGFVEWDERTQGNWKTGTVAAVAVHYNRTDDALYVAAAANLVTQWEAGATVAGSWTSGEWFEQAYSLLKHWKQGAVDHTGAVTVTVVVDGATVINALALTQGTTVARSLFRFPPGVRGRTIHIKLAWSAGYTGKIVEVLDNVQRKAVKL